MKLAPVKDITNEVQDKEFLIVGDLHGCYDEFSQLLIKAEFNFEKHVLISVGDLFDRGPDSLQIAETCSALNFYAVRGNHDRKFIRYLRGENFKITRSFQTTLDQMHERYSFDELKETYLPFMENFAYILKLHDFYIVHGGFDVKYLPQFQTKEDCIYKRYSDPFEEFLWYEFAPVNYPKVYFGHHVHIDHYTFNNGKIIALDGGCVFGHVLRGYSSKKGIIEVPAKKCYYGHK